MTWFLTTVLFFSITGTLTACPSGYYGTNCGFQCGNCEDGNVCIKTNGTCPGGCAAGWINDTCHQACPDGYYGNYCMSKCGNCLNKDVCNKSTGTCLNGCTAGWMDNTCHNMCEDGRYVSGCTSECGHCKNDTVCDKTNGICGSGCDEGENDSQFVCARLIQLDALQKKPEDNYISLDERTKDPVVENTYEQIKNTTAYVNTGEDPQGRI